MWVMNEKKLLRAEERIWYYPCQDDKDRPQLGYIRGDSFSVAVDAGHSREHVDEFYTALRREGLPLPTLTVLTHWHWDHTFGMHAVSGMTIAGEKTNSYLKDIKHRMCSGEISTAYWRQKDPHIALEYPEGMEIAVIPADFSFCGSMTIDAGNVHISLSETVSPHTDDSVLVYVQEEKALFLGDSLCGVYPTWEIDPVKMRQYIDTLERIDFDKCFSGHWGCDEPDALMELL